MGETATKEKMQKINKRKTKGLKIQKTYRKYQQWRLVRSCVK
jgi:hypothetical protein